MHIFWSLIGFMDKLHFFIFVAGCQEQSLIYHHFLKYPYQTFVESCIDQEHILLEKWFFNCMLTHFFIFNHNFFMSENERKETETIFTEYCFYCIQNRSMETFWHKKLCMKTWYISKFFSLIFWDILSQNIYKKILKISKQSST